MNTSFVPSLCHITASRLIVSLFNHLEVHKNFRKKNYERIKSQVAETLSQLTPCSRLQEKLEKFIDPLILEVENWLKIFDQNWYGYDSVYPAILDTIPECWLSDGTIDREKSVKILVKNEDLRPMNRFIFACTYCFYDDVLDLWKILFKIEKAYLRHKSSPLVKHWVEWLESSSIKSWEFFIEWTLETPLWNSNLYIMRHCLRTLRPLERSQYLLKALIGKEVTIDVMRFCLSIMTKDEEEQICRESPVEVFRCISSWPLQSIFYDVIDNLRHYLTEESFCNIIDVIIQQLNQQDSGCVQLIEILQHFWARSPRHFQNTAKEDFRLTRPLQYLLDFDISQVFSKEKFIDYDLSDLPDMPAPQAMIRLRRRRIVRRRYLNIL